VARHQ
jgi:hypothetical protein